MSIITTLIAAFVGAALREYLRVPAGALLGAMIAVAVVNISPAPVLELPGWAKFAAFTALGWAIGQGISMEVLRSLIDKAGLIAVTVGALLLFGALMAMFAVRMDLLDPATAYLATSPGGLSQMTALSAAVGADAAVVATLHTFRILATVFIAPLILRLLPTSS